jgi:hypothetical protein
MAKSKAVAAESKTFEGVMWLASRPAVLPFLTNAQKHEWGDLVTFYGTAEELVAAGLAHAGMFDIGKSGQRTWETEFGDRYIVRRLRGKWNLEIYTNHENMCAPSDEYPRPTAWWRKHGGEAEAETRRILAGLRKEPAR